MMLRFVTCVTLLTWGDIFQQSLAANLEHFANGVDSESTGDLGNDVKGIRNADCIDKLPSVTTKNANCKKLEALMWGCDSLDETGTNKVCKKKLSETLCATTACKINKVLKKAANNCKKALKKNASKLVEEFCPAMCNPECSVTEPPIVEPPPNEGHWHECGRFTTDGKVGKNSAFGKLTRDKFLKSCPIDKSLRFTCGHSQESKFISRVVSPFNLMSSECVEFEKGSLWPVSSIELEEGQPPFEDNDNYILEIGTAKLAGQCGKPTNIFGSVRIFMRPGVELHCAGSKQVHREKDWWFSVSYLDESKTSLQPVELQCNVKGAQGDGTRKGSCNRGSNCLKDGSCLLNGNDDPCTNNDDCDDDEMFCYHNEEDAERFCAYCEFYDHDCSNLGNPIAISNCEVRCEGRVSPPTCKDTEFWCNMISDYECQNGLARERCPATCGECNVEGEGSGDE